MRLAKIFLLPLFALFLSSPLAAETPKSIQPVAYVTDLAGVITGDSVSRLDALCAELRQKTGAQMTIVTVTSLEGEPVEQFANELFQSFGVGQKKENNGVLLLIAPNEHKYWTEVGYGLEPVINDARAGDAGRLMVPYFRQGNFSAGIEAAARQLADYIAKDKGVTLSGLPPRRDTSAAPADSDSSVPILSILFFVFFAGSIVFNVIRWLSKMSGPGPGGMRGGRWGGSGWTGGGWTGGGFGGGSSGWGGFGGGSSGGDSGFGGFGGGSSGGGGAGGSW